MADEANANDARKAGATEVARLTRRDMLRRGLALAASIGIPSTGLSIARAAGNPASQADHSGDTHMSTITTKDGTTIYYKDWGKGPVVTFSHGWPLNSDAWDGQMLFLAQHGYRCVAHDRRGHGRSSQASATPRAAAKWRAISAGTAPSASRKQSLSLRCRRLC